MRTPRPDPDRDVELSLMARRGDKRAWRTIIRTHTPSVYRLAARMLGAGPDAEDACQEVFMRAHRSFDTFDTARPLGPWLGRITYHTCLARLGAAQRAGRSVDPATFSGVEDEATPTPERAAAAREVGRQVLDAMEQLSAQDRALVTLRYVDELTDVELAEAVGMNRNTVRTRLHRARLVLMQALSPVLGGGRGR